jgi:hypothetical protein
MPQMYRSYLGPVKDSARQIDGKHRHELRLVAKAFERMDERKRKLFLGLAKKMGTRSIRVYVPE